MRLAETGWLSIVAMASDEQALLRLIIIYYFVASSFAVVVDSCAIYIFLGTLREQEAKLLGTRERNIERSRLPDYITP